MNITNPNALWLLSFLVIPILIHLFQFRRYKKLKFSNVAFLKAINQEQRNTRRLKHLLILLSRLLFIIFFVLCIAKPFWPSQKAAGEVNLIILDQSASNLSLAEGRPNAVLEENMNLINQLQEQFPENIKIINELGGNVEPYNNVAIHPRSTSINLEQLLKENENASKVLLLSDFQTQVIDDNKSVFSDSSRQFVMMPPYNESPANLLWDSVWVTNNTLNESVILQFSKTGSAESVNIALENEESLLGSRQVTVEENTFDTISFQLQSASSLQDKQRFTFTSEDAVATFDNKFYFNKINFGKIKVILLSGDKENNNIRSLFEGNDLFEFSSENVNNYSFQSLDNYDVAIVKVGSSFNSFQADALKAYAERGNTLIIIPEADFTATELLSGFGLGNVRLVPSSDQEIKLQNPDPQNPFFNNIFQKTDRNMNMPEAALFLNWQSGQNLLAYINGYPFLSRTGQNQNIYTFSAPLNLNYTNFERHGLFLPIFYKMAFFGKSENRLNYHFLDEDVIEFTHAGIPSGTILKIENEEQELIPDQRINGDKISLILPQEEIMAGFYELRDSKTDSLYSYLAFNYPKDESRNSFYTAVQLQELFSASENITVLDEYDISTLESYLLESKEGFPLWKYFLILALLSLLAEVLIIRLLK
ncbi:membrane protein [Marivirga lumbricoides]|uniref:Membrane protein n=1 Tax=Marivirga lumbricoides TaxID=1046115 RepID=A0ABQ1MX57_9BACT|nr:membrane protein [Marivirga lumbricoides]